MSDVFGKKNCTQNNTNQKKTINSHVGLKQIAFEKVITIFIKHE